MPALVGRHYRTGPAGRLGDYEGSPKEASRGSTTAGSRAVRITRMALGLAPAQDRFESPRELLGDRLRPGSIYRLLADEGARIFPDDYFADLYSASARAAPPCRPGCWPRPWSCRPSKASRTGRPVTGWRWTCAGRRLPAWAPGPKASIPRSSPASATACGLLVVPAASLRTPGPSPATPVLWATGPGCSTPPRSMTPWPPRTPSPSCGRPSGNCW